MRTQSPSFGLPALIFRLSLQEVKSGRIIYPDTLQRVLGFMLPWRSRESTCCREEDLRASGVCNQSWV